MKTLFLTLLALLAIGSASAQEKYTLRGVVNDSSVRGKKIYLLNTNTQAKLDSATVSEVGTFRFVGQVPQPTMLQTRIEGSLYADFVAERGTIDLVIGSTDTVSGTPLNKAYQQFNKTLIVPSNAFYQSLEAYGDKLTKAIYDSIRQSFPTLSNIPDIARKLLTGNKNNVVGGLIMEFWLGDPGMEGATFDSLVAVVGPVVLENPAVHKEIVRRRAEAATSEGQQFVDFEGVDTLGNKMRLSDFVGEGKWVLVDFWSSWCGPCRNSMSELAEMKDSLSDANFMIVGVNVWERKIEDFKKAMTQLPISWPVISVEGGHLTNKATQAYGVYGIPTMLLIDPSGKIVLRAHFLYLAKVKELVTKTN